MPEKRSSAVESPALLFRDLAREDEFPFLWSHQEKMLEKYYDDHLDTADVAFELPTGSGKTLVGLLIAEYRRKADSESVVFLCPTRQLCNQVCDQAARYGIAAVNLSGGHRKWDAADLYRFQQAEATAVATYSTVFNSSPAINDVGTFICDDAHAAADYVVGMWSFRVDRRSKPKLFDAIVDLLRPVLPTNVLMAIDDGTGQDAVDLISTIRLAEYFDRLRSVITQYLDAKDDLRWSWSEVSSKLDGCNLYISSKSLEIRPIIPPTGTHALFTAAGQRVYMSATLGEDGDLERGFGRKSIRRLPIPQGWDTRSTGRRLIMQPGLSLESSKDAVLAIIEAAGRVLWLSNSTVGQEGAAEMLKDHGFAVHGLDDRDLMVEQFIETPSPAAIVAACRYDGMDLKGDHCRVTVVHGLPRSLGLQERFLFEKLQAEAELRDRVRTRVLQSFGRCTRGETDYSLVLVLDGSLDNWLSRPANTKGMHPESQAEIKFGAKNSMDVTEDEFVDLCKAFLEDRGVRHDVDRAIRSMRDDHPKVADTEAAQLVKSAGEEIRFCHQMWSKDFAGAVKSASGVLDALEGERALRPYRGFWHHERAVAAYLAWKAGGGDRYRDTCLQSIRNAMGSSYTVTWLAQIEATLEGTLEFESAAAAEATIRNESVLAFLARVKLVGGKFDRLVSQTATLLESTKASDYEAGLQLLGGMLGARASRPEGDGVADGLWRFDGFAVALEAKSDADVGGSVSIATVRQAISHEARLRADDPSLAGVAIHTVVVTPQAEIDQGAQKIADQLHVCAPADMLELFMLAVSAMRDIRADATGASEESVASLTDAIFRRWGISSPELKKRLTARRVVDMPVR